MSCVSLSSPPQCQLSTETSRHRSRPLFWGHTGAGRLYTETPPAWTASGAGTPRGPHQPWMWPLLAVPPGVPHPPSPLPTLPCFPSEVHDAPQAQHLPPNHQQTKAPHSSPTCPSSATISAGRASDLLPCLHQPCLAVRAQRHLPTLQGDAAQQTVATWPCPNPAYLAPAGLVLSRAVGWEWQWWPCLHRDIPAGCKDGDSVAWRSPGYLE